MNDIAEQSPSVSLAHSKRSKGTDERERIVKLLVEECDNINEIIEGGAKALPVLRSSEWAYYEDAMSYHQKIEAWSELARYASQYIEHVIKHEFDRIELKLKLIRFETLLRRAKFLVEKNIKL